MGGETALLDGVTRIAKNRGFRPPVKMKMTFRDLAQADWEQVVAEAVVPRVPAVTAVPARAASVRGYHGATGGLLDMFWSIPKTDADVEQQQRQDAERKAEAQRKADAQRKAEARRKAEEAEEVEARRKAEEAEARRKAEEAEARRRAREANEAKEAKRALAQSRAEEAKKAEEAEEAKKAEEARRKAEAQRRLAEAEAQRRAQEANEAEEAEERRRLAANALRKANAESQRRAEAELAKEALLEAQREADRKSKEVSDELTEAARTSLAVDTRRSLWALVDVAILRQRTVDMSPMITARQTEHENALQKINNAPYATYIASWTGRENDLLAEKARYKVVSDKIEKLDRTLKPLYVYAVSLARRIELALTPEQHPILLQYADESCTSIICRPPYADPKMQCSWRRRPMYAEQEWTVSGVLARIASFEGSEGIIETMRVSEEGSAVTRDDFAARIKDAYEQLLAIEASLFK
jgi:hypothetical protein